MRHLFGIPDDQITIVANEDDLEELADSQLEQVCNTLNIQHSGTRESMVEAIISELGYSNSDKKFSYEA